MTTKEKLSILNAYYTAKKARVAAVKAGRPDWCGSADCRCAVCAAEYAEAEARAAWLASTKE